MKTLTADQRKDLACGYEPPRANASGWAPDVRRIGWQGMDYEGSPPATCPGYTTRLPEVIEVIRARGHWKTGQLADVVGAPTDHLVMAIETLEAETNRCQNFYTTSTKHGGGREDAS